MGVKSIAEFRELLRNFDEVLEYCIENTKQTQIPYEPLKRGWILLKDNKPIGTYPTLKVLADANGIVSRKIDRLRSGANCELKRLGYSIEKDVNNTH